MVASTKPCVGVRFPNLFVSFLEKQPRVNARYANLRRSSENDVCRACNLSPSVASAVRACDFGFFAGVMCPDADEARLRTICDWGNWIFPFDDIFDDGEFSDNYEGAQAVINKLLAGFDSPDSSAYRGREDSCSPIITFHDGIWERIRAVAPPNTAYFYEQAMRDYCTGAVEQVRNVAISHGLLLEQMLAMRRKSVCVATLFSLVLYGQEITLPDYVLENKRIREIERIGIDLTLMHNDLLSYYKEQSEGVPHNLVAVCRFEGMTVQDAVDRIAQLIDGRHARLQETIASVPQWDPNVNAQVARYITGIQNVVKANLYWSFKSARFLNEDQKNRLLLQGTISLA